MYTCSHEGVIVEMLGLCKLKGSVKVHSITPPIPPSPPSFLRDLFMCVRTFLLDLCIAFCCSNFSPWLYV